MKVAFDLDGTADSDPHVFQSLMSALRAAGHVVVILTGCSMDQPGQGELDKKQQYLSELGLAHCWDELVVFPNPPHKAKAEWIKNNDVAILVDNSIKNAKFASKYCTVLLPWNTRHGDKEG